MTKTQLLDEIKRTAAANGGVPLGWRKFATETGIDNTEWLGKLWARWSDAVKDDGFEPNQLNQAYAEQELLDRYAKLTVKFDRLPTEADIRLSINNGTPFPNHKTLVGKYGGKLQFITKLREFCQARAEYASIVALCDSYVSRGRAKSEENESNGQQIGFVYLMKSAKFYKIGKATVTGRRHRELAIQLPERLILVHEIRTDDPFGIEAYWHNRFAEKRRGGEWFELNSADVSAFKRRKFM